MIDRRAALGILAGKGLAMLGLAEMCAAKPQPLAYAPPPTGREKPAVNIGRKLREWNWGGGSCVFASLVMVLRWSGNYEAADYVRKNFSGGESYNGLTSKLTRLKIPWYSSYTDGTAPPNHVAFEDADKFAHLLDYFTRMFGIQCKISGTANGDARALFQSIQDRRGAVIFYKPNHSIMLNDIDETEAIVLDNNNIERFESYPTKEFIPAWQRYGGVAVVPVIGTPRPPQPA